MNELTKAAAAVKCPNCGKFRSVKDDFTAPTTAQDDPSNPQCDDCVAAKAMDIPAVLVRPDGSEEMTTVGKALGIDKVLELTELGDRIEVLKGQLAHDAEMLLKRKMIDEHNERVEKRRGLIVRTVRDELARRKVAATMAKADKMNRKTAKTTAKTAKLKRKTEVTESLIAEQQRHMAKQAERLAEVSQHIGAMQARLESGNASIRRSAEYQAIADLARQDQVRAGWAEKARLTTDPILRQGYLNLAEAKGVDDDDD
jgi:hypothetical protein